MAAGIGRRFGGVKQIEAVGAFDEKIIDYSVFDAVRAGFDNIVFVISREIEADFRKTFFLPLRTIAIGRGFSVSYVFQETPDWRQKPLGTTSAVMAARSVVHEPFCLINADDFYGRTAFATVAKFFRNKHKSSTSCMVAYPLCNTMSSHGTVSRGVLSVHKGQITNITEQTFAECRRGHARTLVSMNCFGFTPEIFAPLGAIYDEFLQTLGHDPDRECQLSGDIGKLLQEKSLQMQMLKSPDRWLGFTYRADKESVVAKIAELTKKGVYPSPLWKK